MHIEQVDHVKLLGIFVTSVLTTSTNINSIIAVMNKRIYMLNQFRKQELDIRGFTQIIMSLVVVFFQ